MGRRAYTKPAYVAPTDAELLNSPMTFEPHNLAGTTFEGEPMPFGYISTKHPSPIFELNNMFAHDPVQLTRLAKRMAAANEMLTALKDQLDGHWATWMAARAEVEGAETSKQLFEREPDVIRARALIAKFEA